MSCHKFQGRGCVGVVCLPNIYEFGGFTFQWHNYLGPVKLKKKDFSTAKREGKRFYQAVEKWMNLDDADKNKTLVFS